LRSQWNYPGPGLALARVRKLVRELENLLAVLTTEVETAFHLKNQVLVAFLNITRAYDNV
jgi:hypothetical protein